ncbi:MAG: hypothetical protein HY551_05340, partial [Elusimicrobia bacterium]|nr:hypothetical protein [Elusimicrobiota bacterium]
KQTALWSLLAFGGTGALLCRDSTESDEAAAVFRWREALRRAGLYVAGCAVIPGLTYLYFGLRGASRELLEQVLWRNMDYAAILVRSGAWRDQLEWFLRTAAPQFLKGGWPAYAAAALGLAATRLEARRAEEILATLWLGSALIGCATGLFLFPHYFLQAYPPLAFLAGAGIQRLGESRSGARYASWLAAGLCLYPVAAHARAYFVESPERTARRLLYPNPLFEAKALADFIRSRSNETDRMYVFGSEPQLYWYAGLRAATEHIFVYPLTLFPRGYQEIWRELHRLETTSPRFIVYVQQGASTLIATREGEVLRSGVISLLARRYRWIGTVDIRPEGSRAFFMEHGLGPGADEPLMPDGSSQDRIYLFEARSAGNQ